MRLIAVTTCTDRKRYPVPPVLDASTFGAGSQSVIIRAWRKRIRTASSVGLAQEVYCGRSFQEALSATRAGRAEFRIISGGLGLILGDDLIPAYSLSLVRQSREFIGARVVGAPFDASRWWREIQRSCETSPLAQSIRANRKAIAVIGITSTYLSLIADDLATLKDDELDRIRLIGLGIENACPERLRRCILPYDDRLDGSDSPIRGTRGDFSSRAMHHFIKCVLSQHKSRSLDAHKSFVARCLDRWRRPISISRPSKTDEQIIRIIKKNWKAIDGRSSKGLRYLRDVEAIACEQGRFRTLFHRAAQEVRS